MNINNPISNDMPEGLGFSMAMNVNAMKNFSKMTEEERKRFMEESRQVKSKSEMNQLVSRLEKNIF